MEWLTSTETREENTMLTMDLYSKSLSIDMV